jgi:hypothetical protein
MLSQLEAAPAAELTESEPVEEAQERTHVKF